MKLAPEGSKLKVKAVYQGLLFPDTSLLPHFWFYTFLKKRVKKKKINMWETPVTPVQMPMVN